MFQSCRSSFALRSSRGFLTHWLLTTSNVSARLSDHTQRGRASLPLRQALRSATCNCPSWVKLRRTQCEHMFSGLPLLADIARSSRHVSKVPLPDSCTAANTPLFDDLVARTRSAGGASRPRAFAVLRLDHQLELGQLSCPAARPARKSLGRPRRCEMPILLSPRAAEPISTAGWPLTPTERLRRSLEGPTAPGLVERCDGTQPETRLLHLEVAEIASGEYCLASLVTAHYDRGNGTRPRPAIRRSARRAGCY
jgi:hypothetical protein